MILPLLLAVLVSVAALIQLLSTKVVVDSFSCEAYHCLAAGEHQLLVYCPTSSTDSLTSPPLRLFCDRLRGIGATVVSMALRIDEMWNVGLSPLTLRHELLPLQVVSPSVLPLQDT